MADPSRYFTLPEDGADRMRIVQILCYPARPTADGHARWVLERTVVPVPGSDVSHVLGGAAADYMAKKISDAVFANSDVWWIVSDPAGFGAGARDVGSAQQGLHRLLLGYPATAVCKALGVPGPAAGVAGGIAAEIPLPIDRPLVFIKTLLEVGGMAVGVFAGCPVLTTACCKAFVHDQLTRAVAGGIHEVVRGALAAPDQGGPAAAERDRGGPAAILQDPHPLTGRQGRAHGTRAVWGGPVRDTGGLPPHAFPVPPAGPAAPEPKTTPGRPAAPEPWAIPGGPAPTDDGTTPGRPAPTDDGTTPGGPAPGF